MCSIKLKKEINDQFLNYISRDSLTSLPVEERLGALTSKPDFIIQMKIVTITMAGINLSNTRRKK